MVQRKEASSGEPIDVRPLRPGEEAQVAALITAAFHRYVAQDLSPRGIREFLHYAAPDALLERSSAGHLTLVARDAAAELLGMIEIRDNRHLSMLFVAPAAMGRGVGRALYAEAERRVRRASPGVERITVNASRYAVPVYERFGFRTTGPEQVQNGILFVPMARELD